MGDVDQIAENGVLTSSAGIVTATGAVRWSRERVQGPGRWSNPVRSSATNVVYNLTLPSALRSPDDPVDLFS